MEQYELSWDRVSLRLSYDGGLADPGWYRAVSRPEVIEWSIIGLQLEYRRKSYGIRNEGPRLETPLSKR
jgi:hypothetical protein